MRNVIEPDFHQHGVGSLGEDRPLAWIVAELPSPKRQLAIGYVHEAEPARGVYADDRRESGEFHVSLRERHPGVAVHDLADERMATCRRQPGVRRRRYAPRAGATGEQHHTEAGNCER